MIFNVYLSYNQQTRTHTAEHFLMFMHAGQCMRGMHVNLVGTLAQSRPSRLL